MTSLGKSGKLLLCGLFCLVLASTALAQFQFQPGGKGNKGGFSQDPEERFKNYANGKDYIDLSDPTLKGFTKFGLEAYAKENNITDGKITRDQYLKYSEEFKKKMQGGFSFKGNIPPPGGAPIVKPGDAPAKPGDPPAKPGDPNAGKGPEKKETPEEFEKRLEKETENYFKARDHNQDGFLNVDEMSRTLRENYKKFDKNGDNLIDFNECKDYMRAFLKGEVGFKAQMKDQQQHGNDHKPGSPSASGTEITINLSELDERPEVFTGTNLPKGLPPWFAEIDTDKDGMIGLYEWIEAKKTLEEFKAIDRNGDGFLTPEEVLLHFPPAAGTTTVVSASPGSVTPGVSAAPAFGTKDQTKGKFGGFPGFPGGGKKDKSGYKKEFKKQSSGN